MTVKINTTDEEHSALFMAAQEVMLRAYAPYSRFKVGAALLSSDGRIFSGCNIENASFGAGTCAERAALAHGVSQGVLSYRAIAVAGSSGAPTPCGICRQALFEVGGRGLLVIWGESPKSLHIAPLGELLPHAFGPEDLEG